MASGSSTAASGSGSGPSFQISVDAVLHEITSSQDDVRLNNFLRTYARESREVLYASLLASGQDPLSVLDARNNTLGYLYLLSARLTVPNTNLPPSQAIQQFCKEFDPVKARLAPERITLLAKGIVSTYDATATVDQSIPLLLDLITRYPPTLHHLTTIHPILLRICVATRHFSAALPVLEVPITEIDTSLSDLHYNDNLIYHYAGGIALGALKRWAAAEEFFEIVVGSPAHIPAAIQLEAFKKLALVQLILYGKLKDAPKYVNPTLVNVFKKSPYGAFASNYPLQSSQLESLAEKEQGFFEADKNLGLVRQALARSRRWAIKKLTETYITLSLTEIAQAINVPEEDTVRSLILSMIEENEIRGTISGDGTVTFEDTVPTFSKTHVDRLLASAQQQGAGLVELDRKVARSREFLTKSLKNKEGNDWSNVPDEDVFTKSSENWAEEAVF
ncbi:hypothetical protein ACEPAF_2293 [Sanghuangporus sanghuang]